MRKRRKLKCSKCEKTLVEAKGYGTFDNVLRVRLEGGYAEFVDDIVYSSRDKVTYPLYHYLCHKCAHELMDWLSVPKSDIKGWHPKDASEPLCEGWEFPGHSSWE